MKRIVAMILVVLCLLALFGCNVVPNATGVTPYTTVTPGNRYQTPGYNTVNPNPKSNPNNVPNTKITQKGVNTVPFGGSRKSVNPPDKSLLPGA